MDDVGCLLGLVEPEHGKGQFALCRLLHGLLPAEPEVVDADAIKRHGGAIETAMSAKAV